MNAGQMFKDAFATLLETFGGPIVIYKNFKTNNQEIVEAVGMKNSPKGNSSIIMFQFPERLDVSVGDVLQQKDSSDFWRIYSKEDHMVGTTLVNFQAFVDKIDKDGKLLPKR